MRNDVTIVAKYRFGAISMRNTLILVLRIEIAESVATYTYLHYDTWRTIAGLENDFFEDFLHSLE